MGQPEPIRDDLFEELWAVVARKAVRAHGEGELALVAHALAAALALDPEERAWALNALGSTLRGLGHHEHALEVLRVSIRLNASERARLAAATCALATLCDQGELERARALGEMVREWGSDSLFLETLGRVYYELSLADEDFSLRRLAAECFEEAARVDAPPG